MLVRALVPRRASRLHARSAARLAMPGWLSQAGRARAHACTHSFHPCAAPDAQAWRPRPDRVGGRGLDGAIQAPLAQERAQHARRRMAHDHHRVVHGESGGPRAPPTHMFARVALRANLDMCCAGPPLSARSRLTARPPVCLSRAPSGVTQRDEGATLLTYLLSYGCRVPEHSLRSNLKDLVKSAQFSAAKILTVCASAAQRASRAPQRLALALPPMTDDPHPADSLPSRAQALELIKSYDTEHHY